MRRSHFTGGQIQEILKKEEQGKNLAELCREYGISRATFYSWKVRHGGTATKRAMEVKELQAELSQYKRIVAEQLGQIYILRDKLEQMELKAVRKKAKPKGEETPEP